MGRRAVKIMLVLLLAGGTGLWTASRAASGPDLPVGAPLLVTRPFRDVADTLRRRETLSHLFARHDIAGAGLYRLLDAATGLRPRRVQAGQVFEFRYAGDAPRPVRVRTRLNPNQLLWLRRDSTDAWHAELEDVAWNPQPLRISGPIASSVYQTIIDLIPDSILPAAERDRFVWDLTDGVFGWVIDFTRDVLPDDHFNIVLERLVSSLGEVRYGRVVAAKLETRGLMNTAYVMSDDDGRNVYYDADGLSLRRAFKRNPVPYRITSRFSLSRFHPILKTWRAHLGIDYHAPIGTPVSATANGTVIRAGRWGGYGIMVALRHVNGIETRYAHLSRLAHGIHRGERVTQGDVIGYSGMTGLATAPHVHYEFLKNGRHQNPTRIDLGDGTPVPAARHAEFEALRHRYDRMLTAVPPRIIAFGAP